MTAPRQAVDLFAGRGSFTRAALARGYKVDTYDLLPLSRLGDLHWHHSGDARKADLPHGAYFLWASPPCEGFSVGSIGHHWTKELPRRPKTDRARLGLDLLRCAVQHIAQTRPRYWALENPRGMMRVVIDDILAEYGITDYRRCTVTYCQYGDDRMKPTDIWNNIHAWTPRPHCNNGDPCHTAAPRGSRTGTQGRGNYLDRSKVPTPLVEEILEAVE